MLVTSCVAVSIVLISSLLKASNLYCQEDLSLSNESLFSSCIKVKTEKKPLSLHINLNNQEIYEEKDPTQAYKHFSENFGYYLTLPGMEGYYKAIYQLAKDVTEAFSKYNIPIFAIGGTLLGIVRHKGFISHDDDLDFGITEDHILGLEMAFEELRKLGYIAKTYEDAWIGWKIERWFDPPCVHNIDRILCCDIFFLKKTDNQYEFAKGWPKYTITEQEIFPLQKGPFGILNLPVPNDYKSLLNKRFKTNWPYQMRKYNHVFSPFQKDTPFQNMEEDDYLPADPFGPLQDKFTS